MPCQIKSSWSTWWMNKVCFLLTRCPASQMVRILWRGHPLRKTWMSSWIYDKFWRFFKCNVTWRENHTTKLLTCHLCECSLAVVRQYKIWEEQLKFHTHPNGIHECLAPILLHLHPALSALCLCWKDIGQNLHVPAGPACFTQISWYVHWKSLTVRKDPFKITIRVWTEYSLLPEIISHNKLYTKSIRVRITE